ncbi:hypothetical protein [Acanthopleuribacter pedis]|uniref:Uncharacterized protein n=1 Tax=Acanthopleuribacter pedis TaxID=442870 RepID=A0A8J7U4F8_9BACT|nr:hypothetical protein [Acanthopleuribacter pedis]MBO1321438.1 hypothetical protein [Acanthopleuribacter pedis]
MSLFFRLQGDGAPLPELEGLEWVTRRRFAEPLVHWATTDLGRASHRDQEGRHALLDHLAAGVALSLGAFWQPAGGAAQQLTPFYPIQSITETHHPEGLCFQLLGTVLQASGGDTPSPHRPRYRVHAKQTYAGLLRAFTHVAELPADLENNLPANIELAGDLVQDGESDAAFLRRLIAPERRGPGVPGLVLTGTCSSTAVLPYTLLPGDVAACRAFFQGRSLPAAEPETLERRHFPAHRPPTAVHYLDRIGLPEYVVTREHPEFDADRWQTWFDLNLPRFHEDAFVVALEDRLTPADGGTHLRRRSHIHLLSGAADFTQPTAHQSWCRLGTVTENDGREPWLGVRLAGFEARAHGDQLRARLLCPTSGEDGRGGLHLVPAVGTTVAVFHSGRLDEAPVVLGNVREEAAGHAAPSLSLTQATTLSLAEVTAEQLGAVAVKSALDLTGESTISVKGENLSLEGRGGLSLKGAQAEAELSGSDFKVGGP